jgi:hypothetical protein
MSDSIYSTCNASTEIQNPESRSFIITVRKNDHTKTGVIPVTDLEGFVRKSHNQNQTLKPMESKD